MRDTVREEEEGGGRPVKIGLTCVTVLLLAISAQY